jgi:hypothetical protein
MFTSLNLDIHKDAISIPGLSLKSLWSSKEPGIEFKLFQDNEKLYDIYRNNLGRQSGAPSNKFLKFPAEILGKMSKCILFGSGITRFIW